MDSSDSTRRSTRSRAHAGIADNLRTITLGLAAPQASSSRLPSQSSDYALLPEPTDPNPPDEGQLTPVTRRSAPPPDESQVHSVPGNAPDPDPDPDPESDPDEDSADAPNLARSLALLARNIADISATPKTSTAIKPRNPDTFDGTDSSKLDTFIFQCSMYISARSKDFPDEASRVTFTLSFLKGTPLDWFQTELNHSMTNTGEFPKWFTSYTRFLSELQRLFGPRDPVNDAMIALEALRYKDSTKVTRYTLDFNRHSRRTGWNEAALSRIYYKGLPDRLKDEISRIGKPVGLLDLQDLVATLDQRYWERQSEISRDKKPNPHPHKSPERSSDTRADNRSSSTQTKGGNQQQQSRNKDQKKPSSTPSTSSSNPGNKASSIADILGPDGKLKPEERQRRMDNKLCLRCGEAGHLVNDCNKTTSKSKPKPKARAATVASSSASTAAPATSSASGKA